ncbi:MAG: nuclear transport factor 2 family protein [Bryobacteraceae bacterium]
MKQLVLTTLVAVTSLMIASAQSDEALRAAEQQWSDATTKMDYAALDKILANDLIYTHSNGVVDNKAQFIESLKNGTRKYESVQIEEMTVRNYGKTAAVAGKVKMVITARGQTSPRQMRFLRFWVKNKGQWQLVAHQSAQLAQ